MSNIPEEPHATHAQLNPLLHEPARLHILAALAPADYVDFSALLRITGVSKSALSKHLSALPAGRIIAITNSAHDKRVRRIALTESGREAFDTYLQSLEQIVHAAKGGHRSP